MHGHPGLFGVALSALLIAYVAVPLAVARK